MVTTDPLNKDFSGPKLGSDDGSGPVERPTRASGDAKVDGTGFRAMYPRTSAMSVVSQGLGQQSERNNSVAQSRYEHKRDSNRKRLDRR